jgi:acetyltransferase-like isoleucine patch superfamily enzyme
MDIAGKANKNLYNLHILILKLICTPFNLFAAYLYGINIHKSCRFIGMTKFVRKPNSFINIGNNCEFLSKQVSNLIGINHRCILTTLLQDAQIIIGNGCGFSGTVVAAAKSITIGHHVRCGANTLITDSDWHFDDPRVGPPKEIVIMDNVWLGVNSVVLKGVTIGENTIIGANSVVTKSIPANVVAAGNPCKFIKKIH